MDVLKLLVSRVARAFYDPKYIVILDVLNNAPPNSNGIREDDMVPILKMTAREIHKLCGKLREHRLLRMGTRMENRKQDQRPIPKTFYYLDYKEFVDVVKWKMYKMQMVVRDNLRTESENQGFVCERCENQYTPLDVLSLVNPANGLFYCDICESVLKENDNAENVKESQQVLAKLREQSQPIITLLKQTDAIVIPQGYIFKGIGTGPRKNGTDPYELAVAQDTGAGQGDIIVDLQMDNEAARRAKQLEAEEKRQQNALPIWHQRSTVSDGIRGTGDPEPSVTLEHDEEDQFQEVDGSEMDPDTQDYYTKYYESLSQAQPFDDEMSTEQFDDLEADEDEFETVEVNEGNKRSYDLEDDNADESKRIKPNPNENGQMDTEEFIDGDEEIPLVSGICENGLRNGSIVDVAKGFSIIYIVNGKMVPLDEVVEEDQRNMTTEEYKAYYEAWQNWQTN
ncbi:hypothetical protein BCR42DRAFT_410163 [Absidia repens]|uniref:HTH TFE/IIEalpha-type domain-containing protein n=1 Tax=Absidia repens TaxID=90262 RepID=A0A1X2INN5_9FUNG|nr:hypothetical protein BCR42DRAFT_410163 [Absidia repens]